MQYFQVADIFTFIQGRAGECAPIQECRSSGFPARIACSSGPGCIFSELLRFFGSDQSNQARTCIYLGVYLKWLSSQDSA